MAVSLRDNTFNPLLAELLRQTTDYLAIGSNVVDIGCGDGEISMWVASRGYHVSAFDRRLPIEPRARTSLPGRGSFQFECVDLLSFEPAQPVHGVLLLGVLHYATSHSQVKAIIGKIASWDRGLILSLCTICDDIPYPGNSQKFLPNDTQLGVELSKNGFTSKLHQRAQVQHDHGQGRHEHVITYRTAILDSR